MDGSFDYVSGNCNSSRIDIKRVKGFGDRYYLVTIYSKKNRGGGSEFLGVIKKRTLTVYRGTKLHGSSMETAGLIVFNSDGISVSTDGKTCIYRRR